MNTFIVRYEYQKEDGYWTKDSLEVDTEESEWHEQAQEKAKKMLKGKGFKNFSIIGVTYI